MNYSMEPIPTTYKGINFRSKLEAKWAIFFDRCQWRWEYEPENFRGWFPDFALYGKLGNIVWVEVKPVVEFPEDVAEKIDQWDTSKDIEFLILGSEPLTEVDEENPSRNPIGHLFSGGAAIGWMLQKDGIWNYACLGCFHENGLDFYCDWGEWYGRMTGAYAWDGFWRPSAKEIWSEGVNQLQYRNPNWRSVD